MGDRERGLIWRTDVPRIRQLRRDGYTVTSFRDIRTKHIEPARSATVRRASLENAAGSLLRLFDRSPRLAVLGVPTRTAGDLGDIYSFLVEPCFRRDVTLLLGVDQSLDELDGSRLITPEMGYAWNVERLIFIAHRYLRKQRSDGLPPLTPIEEQLLTALRNEGLTPEVQFGIGPYRADFAFPAQRLVVEADGRAWHDAQRDAARDAHLESLGWETLRFSGSEIHRGASDAASEVVSVLEQRSEIVTYSELPPEPQRGWRRRLLDWLLRRRTAPRAPRRAPQDVAADTAIPEWKAHLDIDQRRAVDAHAGVVQVIAPAGSGKTTTMITRVQELLSRGVAANRILCTTFNRATRDELEERLLSLGVPDVEIRSFHALGRSILNGEGHLRAEIGTATYGQWRRISKQAMDSLDDGVWLDAPVASELVSNYKLAQMWDPATARRRARNPIERTAAMIYTLYEEYLEEADRNDFDDLILRAIELLRHAADIRERWQGRWDCVLVDEYQDIEPAQELLIRMVAAPEDSIFAVGDEDQCIYSWRRASVERIVMLDTVYPGLARVVLGTSYRCPSAITTAARELITNNRRRFPKEINPSPISATPGVIEAATTDGLQQGARHVAAGLQDLGDDPRNVVVLARTSRLLREVVRACADLGLPVRAPSHALRPTDAEETVLAYLRLVSAPRTADPSDVRQAFRVPNRYLPPEAETTVSRALRASRSFGEAAQTVAMPSGEDWRRPRILEWGEVCDSLTTAHDAATAVRQLRADGGLDRHYSSVERMSRHDQIEVETLADLEAEGSGVDLTTFVTRLEHRTSALARINQEDGIELATIHGAKGREWDTVVLFAADSDQLPHFRTLAETEGIEDLEEAIEDERRLAYVAITRTRNRLIVVTTSQPSPFLREAGIVASAPGLPTRASLDVAKAARETPTRTSRNGSRGMRSGSKLVSRPTQAPTTQAKYRGRCNVCGRAIHPGTAIVRIDDHWVHEVCGAR